MGLDFSRSSRPTLSSAARTRLRPARLEADDVQRQHDIVTERSNRDFMVLKHQADVLAHERQLRAAQLAQILVIDQRVPLVARSMPATSRSRVDLPAPEWLARNTISPFLP